MLKNLFFFFQILFMKDEIKQVIVVRGDIKMSVGKVVSQCCHASLGAFENANKNIIKLWKKRGEKKVVLQAKNLNEIKELIKKAEKINVNYFVVRDAGKTEVKKGTITCIAFGPDYEKKINKITGYLPKLK